MEFSKNSDIKEEAQINHKNRKKIISLFSKIPIVINDVTYTLHIDN